jgi:DNA-binding PadR family transcriptional regulator
MLYARSSLVPGTLDMLLLGTLRRGARHGHGIGEDIRMRSAGIIRIKSGSLYPALRRLEERGWLNCRVLRKSARQLIKSYHLTVAGRAELLRKRRRWSRTVAAIDSVVDARKSSCAGS